MQSSVDNATVHIFAINFTPSTVHPTSISHGPFKDSWIDFGVMFLGIPLIICNMIGNGVTIMSFISDKMLRGFNQNIYIVNLAFADLLIGLVVMPMYVHFTRSHWYWESGLSGCKIILALHLLALTEANLTFILICYNHLLMIRDGESYDHDQVSKKAIRNLVLTWILSFAIYTPEILFTDTWRGNAILQHGSCRIEHTSKPQNWGLGFVALIECMYPVVLTGAICCLITMILRERTTIDSEIFTVKTHLLNKEKELSIYLFMMVIMFDISWAPYSFSLFLRTICPDCLHGDVFEFLIWVLWLKTVFNPFFYSQISHLYNYNYKRLLCCSESCDPAISHDVSNMTVVPLSHRPVPIRVPFRPRDAVQISYHPDMIIDSADEIAAYYSQSFQQLSKMLFLQRKSKSSMSRTSAGTAGTLPFDTHSLATVPFAVRSTATTATQAFRNSTSTITSQTPTREQDYKPSHMVFASLGYEPTLKDVTEMINTEQRGSTDPASSVSQYQYQYRCPHYLRSSHERFSSKRRVVPVECTPIHYASRVEIPTPYSQVEVPGPSECTPIQYVSRVEIPTHYSPRNEIPGPSNRIHKPIQVHSMQDIELDPCAILPDSPEPSQHELHTEVVITSQSPVSSAIFPSNGVTPTSYPDPYSRPENPEPKSPYSGTQSPVSQTSPTTISSTSGIVKGFS